LNWTGPNRFSSKFQPLLKPRYKRLIFFYWNPILLFLISPAANSPLPPCLRTFPLFFYFYFLQQPTLLSLVCSHFPHVEFLINFVCLNSEGVCSLDSQRKNNLVFKQGKHFLVTFCPLLLVFWMKFHLKIIPSFCYSLTVNFVWNSHLIVDNYLTSNSNRLVSFERKKTKPNRTEMVGLNWVSRFGLKNF